MKAITRTLLVLFLAISSLQTFGQLTEDQIAGSWHGVLAVRSMELRLVFNLSLAGDGSYEATMDSPDQGATGIALGAVSLEQDSIRIEAPALLGFYIGKFLSAASIEGEWHQAGQTFKLDLEKKDQPIVLNRPQEPQAPYPYIEEEITFENVEQGFQLGGTLTLPEGNGPFPAAVLVTGSGSQNRDEEIFGHKPFRLIADQLTRKGIAVLRYDDRGVGSSGGSNVRATSEDYAGDARSAFEYLLERKDIDPSGIGIIGHSEGGMIAFMLASSHDDIAFIISLAGPGVDGKTILLDQSHYIGSLSGLENSVLEDNKNVMTQVYNIMVINESYQTWSEGVLNFTSDYYSKRDSGELSEQDIEQSKENLLASIPEPSYAWFRYFVMFDPAPLFGQIKCPVLALNGEKDCQVLPENNIEAINKALESSGNTQTTTMILPGLNHLFQNCTTGLPDEYGKIEETFDQATIEIMSEWIMQQVD